MFDFYKRNQKAFILGLIGVVLIVLNFGVFGFKVVVFDFAAGNNAVFTDSSYHDKCVNAGLVSPRRGTPDSTTCSTFGIVGIEVP